MQRSSLGRSFVVFAQFPLVASVPLLAGSGCKKDPPPVVDAAPPPPTSAPEDAAPVQIAPMEEDAGADAADAAEAGKKLGPYVNPNVARLRQCCGQLRGEGKKLGLSPEAGFFNAAAAQCDGIAAQAGPSGTAPELGILRTALQGRVLPAACSGF